MKAFTEDRVILKMGDIVDIDASGVLWLIMMDKESTVNAGQLYEWIKETEGYLAAYTSSMKKLAEQAKKMKEKDPVEYKAVEKSFIEAQNKVLKTDISFRSIVPKFDYGYLSNLKGITTTMLLILENAGMLDNAPNESGSAKLRLESQFDAIVESAGTKGGTNDKG